MLRIPWRRRGMLLLLLLPLPPPSSSASFTSCSRSESLRILFLIFIEQIYLSKTLPLRNPVYDHSNILPRDNKKTTTTIMAAAAAMAMAMAVAVAAPAKAKGSGFRRKMQRKIKNRERSKDTVRIAPQSSCPLFTVSRQVPVLLSLQLSSDRPTDRPTK